MAATMGRACRHRHAALGVAFALGCSVGSDTSQFETLSASVGDGDGPGTDDDGASGPATGDETGVGACGDQICVIGESCDSCPEDCGNCDVAHLYLLSDGQLG